MGIGAKAASNQFNQQMAVLLSKNEDNSLESIREIAATAIKDIHQSEKNSTAFTELFKISDYQGSKERLTELYKIALNYLEPNSAVQADFLYQINLHVYRENRRSLQDDARTFEIACQHISVQQNPYVRHALIYAVLMDESMVNIDKIKLQALAALLPAQDIKKIRENNVLLKGEQKAVLQELENNQAVRALVIHKKQFLEAIRETKNQLALPTHQFQTASSLFNTIQDRLAYAENKKQAQQQIQDQINNQDEAVTQIISFLHGTVNTLNESVKATQLTPFRKEIGQEYIDKRLPFRYDRTLHLAAQWEQNQVNSYFQSKEAIATTMQYVLGILIDTWWDNTVNVSSQKKLFFTMRKGFDDFVAQIGLENALMLCTGYDVIQKIDNPLNQHPSNKTRQFMADRLLREHFPADSKEPDSFFVDKLVDAYLDTADDEEKDCIYDVFLYVHIRATDGKIDFNSRKNYRNRCNAIACAMLARPQKQPWLLQNAEDLDNIIDNVKAQNIPPLEIFKTWRFEDFERAVSVSKKHQNFLRWAMLSNPQHMEGLRADNQLENYIHSFNLNELDSLDQLASLPKESRIAILKYCGWEKIKDKFDNGELIKISRILTHDFSENDVEKVRTSKAGLILSFIKHPKKVTRIINDTAAYQTAFDLLSQLHNGFLQQSLHPALHEIIMANTTTRSIGNLDLNCRKSLVITALHIPNNEENEVNKNNLTELLTNNSLVQFHLSQRSNFEKLIEQKAFLPIELVLSHPAYVLKYQEKLPRDLRTLGNNQFPSYRLIACLNALKKDKQEEKKNNSDDIQGKSPYTCLVEALPKFVESTNLSNVTSQDILDIIHLDHIYREIKPLDESLKKALKDNKNAKKAHAALIFSNEIYLKELFQNPFEPRNRLVSSILTTSHDEYKGYEVPPFSWVITLKKLAKWAVLGAALGIAGKAILSRFNPLNWFSGSSPVDIAINTAVGGISTIATTVIGYAGVIGISHAVASFLLPLVLGAFGVIFCGVLVTGIAKGCKAALRSIQGEVDDKDEFLAKVIDGLKEQPNTFKELLKIDPDFSNDVGKALNYCWDKGKDIQGIQSYANLDPGIQNVLIQTRDYYRYQKRRDFTKLVITLLSFPLWIMTLGRYVLPHRIKPKELAEDIPNKNQYNRASYEVQKPIQIIRESLSPGINVKSIKQKLGSPSSSVPLSSVTAAASTAPPLSPNSSSPTRSPPSDPVENSKAISSRSPRMNNQ